MKREGEKFRPLKITSRGKSGLTDVSASHDYYFALGGETIGGEATSEANETTAPARSPQSRTLKK